VYVTVAEWDNEPLPPATVTLYKPTDPPQDNVELPETPSVIVPGLTVQLNPVEGETVVVSATAPVKLLRLVTVIVAVPAWPPLNVIV
jgi:hypothetical protein